MQSYTENKNLATIKLLAVDMDLTLLHTDKSMPAGISELIDGLAQVGVIFCPASGRPVSTLQTMFPASAQTGAFFGDNGGDVLYHGKSVFRDKMDRDVWHELARDASAEPGAVPMMCCYGPAVMLERDKDKTAEARKYYDPIYFVDDFDNCDKEGNKFSILYPAFNAEPAYAKHWGPTYGDHLSVTNAGREWIDVTNPGINKGLGLSKLAAHLGLSMNEVAAVGDTYNDIAMLELAGQSFLVANAEEHMHAHADWLIPSNDEDGVCTLARAIIEAKQKAGA